MAIKNAEKPVRSVDAVFQSYELTPAEIRTTRYLCDGHSVAEITQILNISVHTVRTHLKRTFSKTGTHSQAELIAFMKRHLA